jgi:hypothetical protein
MRVRHLPQQQLRPRIDHLHAHRNKMVPPARLSRAMRSLGIPPSFFAKLGFAPIKSDPKIGPNPYSGSIS